jgi:hypothetical protein
MMAEALWRLLPDHRESLKSVRTVPVKTRRGREIGTIRAVADEFERLKYRENDHD